MWDQPHQADGSPGEPTSSTFSYESATAPQMTSTCAADDSIDTLYPFSQVTLAHVARVLGTYGIDVEVIGIPAA
jgi:hypothetical protein